ncbi:MAG TPA: hypothetical protein VGO59_07170 [Verrucomicrobiae bacterium]
MALTPLPIRLFCDIAAPANLNDLNRNSQAPSFYRGDDIEIDIGVGQNGSLLTGLSGSGAGGIASATAQIFQSENDANSPLAVCTVLAANMNLGLTQVEWTSAAAPFCHAAFLFPNSQTGMSLGGAASVNYWLRVTAQTSDSVPKQITLLDGPITVRDGPTAAPSAPPLAALRYYIVSGQMVPQLLDTATGLYHTLAIFNDGGVLTLQLSDQGY